MNTGTPNSPDPLDIEIYLQEFLRDRRLISCPRFIWIPLLDNIISKARSKKTSNDYKKIWTPQGSIFMSISNRQRDGVQKILDQQAPNCYSVRIAMRYGSPSLDQAFCEFEQQNITDIICLPLFPQTSFATTLSCEDKIQEVKTNHPKLNITTILGYSDNNLWIDSIVSSISEKLDLNKDPQYFPNILFNFHSVPNSFIKKGDKYLSQINQSIQIIVKKLNLPKSKWEIGFQSRFDSRMWLKPTPSEVLKKWAQNNITDVVVLAPGFATDCLETLRECNQDQRYLFITECNNRGNDATFTYIQSLNDRDDHLNLLASLILEQKTSSSYMQDV